MGQRLKRSSLFFKQAGQEPPKPTLSGFYRGVGEAQTGAVQDVAKGVQETTAKLPGEFGIKYDTGAKPEFAGDSAFKPTVDIRTGITAVKPPEAGFATSEQATKAAEQAGKNVEQIEAERKAAEAALGKSTEESLTKAGETSKTAQERLTEKKLGERREASEIEKSAQDYRNILQTTPGTSNVAAVANLMKFYDPKYRPLESQLRQGEVALARQQAGEVESAMQQAESQRAGAIEGYKQASTQAYEDTKKLIDKEKQDKLNKIKEFYSDLSKKEKESGEAAAGKAKELKAVEEEAELKKLKTTAESVKNNQTIASLNNVINAISGRAGNNWLNVRGNEVLGGIRGEIKALTEQAIRTENDPGLNIKQRTKALEDINGQIDQFKGRIAGELAAFLGDTNTRSGDALDAAEQIVAAGLVDSLSDGQKKVIRERLERDKHVELFDRNNLSSPEKLQNIYKAFGGTQDLVESFWSREKAFEEREKRERELTG